MIRNPTSSALNAAPVILFYFSFQYRTNPFIMNIIIIIQSNVCKYLIINNNEVFKEAILNYYREKECSVLAVRIRRMIGELRW